MSVPVKIYRTVTYQEGQTPSNPNLSGDPVVNPINPNGGAAEELVPYDGAIKDVNLGEKGLSTGFVQYDNTPTDTPTGAGTVVWNPDKYTLDLSMGLGDSVQQIGMETYYTPVKNQTGSLIPDGTFVMATGSLGASGRITIAPAVTDGSVDSRYMLGVTTHDIADGEDGLVTWFGEIRGFNTNTKAPVGETWVDGTVLWNNPAVAGGFTNVEPQAPNLKIPVAIVISSGNNGVIFVRPRLGMRLTDLHDVDAFTPSDKDLISYDSALGHWNAKSLGSVIGGTSSQFLKGDGSLDSNTYALASQINIASGQVAFGTGVNTVGGSNNLFWDSVNNRLGVNTNTPASRLEISSTNESLRISGKSSANIVNDLYIVRSSSGTGIFSGPNIRLDDSTLNNNIAIQNSQGQFGIWNFSTGSWVQRIVLTNTNLFGILTTSPTNTLDINGTARIRTLSNDTGDFVTASATGVLQKRTASETLADIGGIGGTIASGQVAFGTGAGTIGGDSGLVWDNVNKRLKLSDSANEKLNVATNTRYQIEIARLSATDNTEALIRFRNSDNTGVYSSYFGSLREPANGARGALVFGTNAGSVLGDNATERMRITSTGRVGIATTSPTNTLDVNGTTRIRTINNATGNFVTKSATGVLQERTPAQVLTDIGGIGGSLTAGRIPFATGAKTLGDDSGLVWDNVNKRLKLSDSANEKLNVATNTRYQIEIARLSTTDNTEALIRFRNSDNTGVYSSYFGSLREPANGARGALVFGTNAGSVLGDNATERMRITSTGLVGIATTSPTNTLDVNGTARIRTLSGTTGYLPLLSSTGVMGQSVVYNTGAGSVLIGTINEVSGHKVRISGGALNITNWQSSAGAYDKLSIDFGEFRGIGYDSGYNEVFFAGTVTVPVKIDTDAPTDSLVINASGNVSVGGQLHSPVVAKGSSSTAVTFDWNDGNIQTVTLTANCTFTFSNPQSGASYQIIITQDATGGRTITWPAGIYWEGKTIPSLTGTASSRDIVTITYDGSNYNALIARNFGT